MSASLVGSEMCIRDRSASPTSTPASGSTPSAASAASFWSSNSFGRGSSGCLLYTSDAADDM
eukprot:4586256-Alexandrium_andersonii.AAC.1